MLLAEQRSAVVEFGSRMLADGLVVGTSGNLSVRAGDLVAVSPSGLPYGEVTAADVGVYRLDGTPVDEHRRPTSELAMHLACYATDGTVGAVVHTHSVAATAVSALGLDEVPAVHYQIAMFGGSVRVAPYATYGTPELAAAMAAAMRGRTGCLLANHGVVTVGATLAHAYDRAAYLEWLCEVFLRARAAGPVRPLTGEQVSLVVEKFRDYGPHRGASGATR